MRIKNNREQFGIMTILLHWVMALLLIGLVILGLYMTWTPISAQTLKLYRWHKEFGMLALMLVILRFTWRLCNVNPSLSELRPIERFAARGAHWLFYVLMFALPISGWLMTSAAGLPVSFFGLFLLPNLISANEESRLLFQKVHEWLGYGLIITFCLHVSAALKHHFINKDNILRRMIS